MPGLIASGVCRFCSDEYDCHTAPGTNLFPASASFQNFLRLLFFWKRASKIAFVSRFPGSMFPGLFRNSIILERKSTDILLFWSKAGKKSGKRQTIEGHLPVRFQDILLKVHSWKQPSKKVPSHKFFGSTAGTSCRHIISCHQHKQKQDSSANTAQALNLLNTPAFGAIGPCFQPAILEFE